MTDFKIIEESAKKMVDYFETIPPCVFVTVNQIFCETFKDDKDRTKYICSYVAFHNERKRRGIRVYRPRNRVRGLAVGTPDNVDRFAKCKPNQNKY